MNILAVINNKGGVGKTTAVQNIGAAIAAFTECTVLLIDLDAQRSLTKGFGIQPKPSDPTVANFILGESTLRDTAIQYKESKLETLPAASSLVQDQEKIKQESNFPFNLFRALKEDTSKKPYDFVIIDCPPSTSPLTDMALAACQRYYVPLQAEYFSYEGLRELISYANKIATINPKIELGGVFASRFDSHIKISRQIIKHVSEQLQDKFLKSYIRENISLSEAQSKGQHIFDYDKGSNGAKDYYNLAKEIITLL